MSRRPSAWLTVWACSLLVAGPGEATEFGWPLALKPALSSSFGETRTTAFHAGIDLKTWGKTGYEVRALGTGWVGRLRTSPWGYGRAVYQKLEDGRILVYAHLDGFASGLARVVKQAQQENQHYSVQLWFEDGELPLAKGELVGWTGDSGAGPPHLHLELRDPDNVPINPLSHGFAIADQVAPTLQRIALVPVGIESTVDGRCEPVAAGLRFSPESDWFETSAVFSVDGRIGVSVLAYDRADAAFNKLAPYRTTLIIDGRPVFSSTYERVSYADAHQVFLDRMRLDTGQGSGRFFNLFRLPGNRLEFYGAAGDGLLHCGRQTGELFLARGVHQLVVESGDVAGNQSRARLQVRVNAPPAIGPGRLIEEQESLSLAAVVEDADDASLEVELAHSRDGEEWQGVERRQVVSGTRARWRLVDRAGLWRLQVRDVAGGQSFRTWALPGKTPDPQKPRLIITRQVQPDFVALVLRVDQVLAAAPQVRVEDGSNAYELVPRQVDLREYRVAVPLNAAGGAELKVVVQVHSRSGVLVQESVFLDQQPVEPGREARLVFGDGAAALVFPAKSAYRVLFPQAEAFRPEGVEHLASTGIGYAFGPHRASFDRKIQVWLHYPEGAEHPEKLGLYQDEGDGQWQFAGNELDLPERMVGAVVRHFSRFALLVDETPPIIGELQPAPGSTIRIRRPRLSAWVDDKGSGIGREEDVVLELDGRPLISEYDPEGHTVEYPVEEDLAPGDHRLVVRVRDMSGNQASVRGDFAVE